MNTNKGIEVGTEIEIVVARGFDGKENVYAPAIVTEIEDGLGGVFLKSPAGRWLPPVFLNRENIDWRRPAPTTFAAVSTDGLRPVVWGAGSTPEAAMDDARAWLAWGDVTDAVLETHPITAAQLEAIEAGDVSWPPK